MKIRDIIRGIAEKNILHSRMLTVQEKVHCIIFFFFLIHTQSVTVILYNMYACHVTSIDIQWNRSRTLKCNIDEVLYVFEYEMPRKWKKTLTFHFFLHETHEHFLLCFYYILHLILLSHAQRFGSNSRRKSMNYSAATSLLCDFTQLEQLPSFVRVLL